MKADTITKAYVRNTDIFADIFNYYIYGGEQVILPEQLLERDTTEIALPYGADGALVPIQKYRDVQKLYAVMRDGKAEYRLCGAELQSEVQYAMAVKNNLYDALEYAGQVEEAARSHRREMEQVRRHPDAAIDKPKPNSGEFLSGFWRTDRLIPSVSLCIYFGADRWDGPMSLFDMMDEPDSRFLACMDNYRVRLIAPALMSDEEIMRFQSSLREVMFFIKYSKDKDALNSILQADKERFQCLERRAADVIKAVTNSGIKYNEREERIDMCQAIQDMRKESKAEGRLEGRAEGRIEGIAIGESQKAQQMAKNFYAMGIDVEKIAQGVGYTVETVRQWLEL